MKMTIVYSSDDKFARHIYISLKSLFETQIKENQLNIYLVDNNISDINKKYLNQLAGNYSNRINYLPFEKIKNDLQGVSLWGGSLSAYARLFLARYISEDIVLYLDGDSVIQGDLSPLFKLDITKFYFAAVQDTAGTMYRNQVGISGNEKYINSGFMLINLKKWQDDNIEYQFLQFIRKYDGKVPCCDQGTLNGVCKGKIMILPPQYNVMTPMLTFKANEIKTFFEIPEYYSEDELKEAREHPVFIHYVGGFFVRPWFINGNHPKGDLYRKYMEQSPWEGQYFAKESLGIRTKYMKLAYNTLPFSIFIRLHRGIRFIKRKVKKV